MIGFCGALDIENRQASFSVLKRMCGMHSEGCAYVNGEIAILSDFPIGDMSDRQSLMTMCKNGYLYTCAVAGNDLMNASSLLELYFEQGDEFVHRLDLPCTACLYDSRCGELTLFRSANSKEPLFFSCRDGVLYFSSSLRPLIRLYGGCVRINGNMLAAYLRTPCENFPDGLFCDIKNIPEGHMLLASSFGESLVPFAERDGQMTYASDSSRGFPTDMRRRLTEEIFLNCYPAGNEKIFEGLTKRECKRAEKQLDGIISEYLALGHGILLRKGIYELVSECEKEKSTPLRLCKKEVLCKTAIWFDSFNLVIC